MPGLHRTGLRQEVEAISGKPAATAGFIAVFIAYHGNAISQLPGTPHHVLY
jgi:hypothetical protein